MGIVMRKERVVLIAARQVILVEIVLGVRVQFVFTVIRWSIRRPTI